jgi:peptidoglycan/xylan/chitin deacetylase (PgdA/CDA1 family)
LSRGDEAGGGPEVRASSRVGAGAVALTFDDGPESKWTSRILTELDACSARATFFVQARRARSCPEMIDAIVSGGHEVGFHCVEHLRHSELTEAEIAADAAEGLAMLEALGVWPRAWRAPWGIVTDATQRVAAAHGLDLWHWSFDSHDWRGDDSAAMLAALDAAGGLTGGEVVLMHDGVGPGAQRRGCTETVLLTRALLAATAEAGLRTEPVSSSRSEVAR